MQNVLFLIDSARLGIFQMERNITIEKDCYRKIVL